MLPITDSFLVQGQLSADDFATAKAAGITLIINNRPDAEEPGILSVLDATKLAQENGMTYIHLPMANGQPLPDDLIPTMQQALKEQEESNGKVLAHCRSGTRSSFLWGIIQVMEGKLNAMQVIDMAANAGINLGGFAPYLQHIEQQVEL